MDHFQKSAIATKGIASVQSNTPHNDRYDRRTSKKQKPYFVPETANGEVNGTREMYANVMEDAWYG